MTSLSTTALEHMKLSSAQDGMVSLPVRTATREQDDGSFHYAMCFDELSLPGYSFLNFDGVDLVVSVGSKALAEGMTIDFVELEAGKPTFIFLNPNDPTYVPPRQ